MHKPTSDPATRSSQPMLCIMYTYRHLNNTCARTYMHDLKYLLLLRKPMRKSAQTCVIARLHPQLLKYVSSGGHKQVALTIHACLLTAPLSLKSVVYLASPGECANLREGRKSFEFLNDFVERRLRIIMSALLRAD